MSVLKEWYGDYNSTLYLQDWCFDNGMINLTILYAHSMVGSRYESGVSYYPQDLENENSDLVKLIRSDFPAGCYDELKQCVADYLAGKPIDRWK